MSDAITILEGIAHQNPKGLEWLGKWENDAMSYWPKMEAKRNVAKIE
jgi:hypothetical protein